MDSAQKRLARIGQDHGLLPSARTRLAWRHDEVRTEIERIRDLSTASLAHQSIVMTGEFYLASFGKLFIEKCCDGEAKNAVAQKFQPLVIQAATGAARARMRQRLGQQGLVFETIAETSLKLLDMRFFWRHSVDHFSDAGPPDLKGPTPGREPARIGLVDGEEQDTSAADKVFLRHVAHAIADGVSGYRAELSRLSPIMK